MTNYRTTCVSGYWNVKNKHGDAFHRWWKNTLKINCPYVFFGKKETIEIIKQHRGDLPTYYIELDLDDFETLKYKDSMYTHPTHCPSKELNMIWNEKIFLVQKACKLNPFNSDFFCWIDAGICTYRRQSPPKDIFPNPNKYNILPKDKFIFSSSDSPICNDNLVKETNYYHFIAGTAYILHKNIVTEFTNLYSEYLDKLIKKENLKFIDQVILTHMYKDNKHLFHHFCHGYGEIIKQLY